MSTGARAQVAIVDRPDGVRVIGLSGELDLSNIEQVDRRIRKEADEVAEVVLHLDGLTFIDSSALNMFDGLRHDLPDHGTQLAVAVGPTATIRRTLEVSGMDELLSTFDTIEEAAASFQR